MNSKLLNLSSCACWPPCSSQYESSSPRVIVPSTDFLAGCECASCSLVLGSGCHCQFLEGAELLKRGKKKKKKDNNVFFYTSEVGFHLFFLLDISLTVWKGPGSIHIARWHGGPRM